MNTQTISLLEQCKNELKNIAVAMPFPVAKKLIKDLEAAIAAERSKEQASVGTIGHIGDGKATLTAAILPLLTEQAKPTHNMPAYPNGECDCSIKAKPQQEPVAVVTESYMSAALVKPLGCLPVGLHLYNAPQPPKPPSDIEQELKTLRMLYNQSQQDVLRQGLIIKDVLDKIHGEKPLKPLSDEDIKDIAAGNLTKLKFVEDTKLIQYEFNFEELERLVRAIEAKLGVEK